MQMLQRNISLIIILFLCLSTFAQDVDYSGTSTANFLKIGMGARVASMGDAGSAVVSDATALFWNPVHSP